jgi:hypothetical protein
VDDERAVVARLAARATAVGAATAISMPAFRAQGVDSSIPVNGMVRQGREHVGEPGSRIDVVELAGRNR